MVFVQRSSLGGVFVRLCPVQFARRFLSVQFTQRYLSRAVRPEVLKGLYVDITALLLVPGSLVSVSGMYVNSNGRFNRLPWS